MKAVLKSDKERLELNLLMFFLTTQKTFFVLCACLQVFASVGVWVSTEPEEAVDPWS